jgi:hypothetical protein
VTDPSDKAVDTEQRLNSLIARLPTTKRNSSTTTIASTSPTDLGASLGLQDTVGPGVWRFRWLLMCVPNPSGAGGNGRFRLATPAFSDGGYTFQSVANGPLTIARFDNTSGGGVFFSGPQFSTTDPVYNIIIEGNCTFTATGLITVQAALTSAGDGQYTIAIGSSLDTWQVL